MCTYIRYARRWPSALGTLTSAFGSVTGSQTASVSYAPSCFFPHADTAMQARVEVLTALISPALVVLMCIALWAIRCGARAQHVRGVQHISSTLYT